MTTDDELKKLLKESIEESKKTREKLESHIKWVRIFTAVKYLIITGILAFAIVELLPFLEPLVNALQRFTGGGM